MRTSFAFRAALAILCVNAVLTAAEDKRKNEKRKPDQPTQNSKCNDVPAHPFDAVLSRPTANSVTLSLLAYQDAEGLVEYGTQRESLSLRTTSRQFAKGEPREIVIDSLQPNTRYYYRFRPEGLMPLEGTFHTQRAAGENFTFTITADSHLDDRASAAMYERTLANAAADMPDFHVDLGDTFMTEKHDNRDNAARQYLAQRYYFGRLCNSAPLFFVLGNHDGESPRGRDTDEDSLAVWSNLMRKKYFPNPIPDGFYTGNATRHPEVGLLQDYYAWQWGDALFVVLDPFWFAEKERGKSDNWKRTLGSRQYEWLKQTLESSTAKYRFVFIHHLVGGLSREGRGGSEAAPLYEWGGHNADGTDGFKQNRPAWPAPIHQLLVRNGVGIVFHGHDHLYVKQDLDGIVYQEVPQPATDGNNWSRMADEFGYKSGVILGSAGHLRVLVASNETKVEYVSARLKEDQRSDRRNGTVSHSYTIRPADAGKRPRMGTDGQARATQE